MSLQKSTANQPNQSAAFDHVDGLERLVFGSAPKPALGDGGALQGHGGPAGAAGACEDYQSITYSEFYADGSSASVTVFPEHG
jgi:hypothetical protein